MTCLQLVCALQNEHDRAGISTLQSPTSLADEVMFLHSSRVRMHQAVWWSYKLDGISAMPELTLQNTKSCIQPLLQIVFACACTSGCVQLIMRMRPRPFGIVSCRHAASTLTAMCQNKSKLSMAMLSALCSHHFS